MQQGNTAPSLQSSQREDIAALDRAAEALGNILLGKQDQIVLALACLLARGHLLIEDLPGLGKTMLAQSIARVLDLEFRRIQFTSDLLPADIVGVSVFRKSRGEFEFQPGPVFSQLLLADEVNRATPKAQSALLEAMEENQVSVDGSTRPLPTPFFVVATQNPADQVGTLPVPESQLDRFLMRLELGYPDPASEREIITGHDRRQLLESAEPVLGPADVLELQATASRVHLSEAIVDYIQALVRQTRESAEIEIGLSPRGAQALASAARAHALLRRHPGVFPDDVQAVFAAVAGHRLKAAGASGRSNPADICRHVLDTVAIP